MATEVIQKAPQTASVGRCGKCHRLLTDPVSLARGYGPICWTSVRRGPEEQRQPLVPPRDWDITEASLPTGPATKTYQGIRYKDGAADVVVNTRETDNDYGNIRHLPHVPYHSPSGFEWGYGGSGPADLARSILADVGGIKIADMFHQAFKWAFIAKLPKGDWTLTEQQIIDWLRVEFHRRVEQAQAK